MTKNKFFSRASVCCLTAMSLTGTKVVANNPEIGDNLKDTVIHTINTGYSIIKEHPYLTSIVTLVVVMAKVLAPVLLVYMRNHYSPENSPPTKFISRPKKRHRL